MGLSAGVHEVGEAGVELLLEVARRLLKAADATTVVSEVARRACEVVGCEVFLNFLLVKTASGPRLKLSSSGGLTPEMEASMQWYELGAPICGLVAVRGERVVWSQCSQPVGMELDEGKNIMRLKTYACFPLAVGSRVVGTLGFGCRTRERFSEEELTLLGSVVEPIALAMERLELEASLRAAKASAEAASRAKDQFIAALSHELRTPLTPVTATLALLMSRQDLPAEVAEDLELIRRNIDAETRLINDLLDFSRVVHGKISLRRERIDVGEFLRLAVREFGGEAAGRRQTLTLELGEGLGRVFADPLRLRQILTNLLSNAIKFTPEGGRIEVWAGLREGGGVVVSVKDTGIGIPRELMPRLFDPFEQGDGVLTRRPAGLGMGLSIARAMAELHGGTLRAESGGTGQGACFTLELPAGGGGSEESAKPSLSGGLEPAQETKPHLLLVEDHADTLRVLSRYLEAVGYDVTPASSCAEALAVGRSRAVDIVVSDIGLPDGDGNDLLRRIRGCHPKVKAVAVSGFGMESDRRKSMEAGFGVHLTKPVDLRTLREALVGLGVG